MLGSFVAIFLDFLLPPRASEKIVRTLTLDELQKLSYGSDTGALPYGDRTVKALVWELKYHANSKAAKLAGQFLSDELLAAAADELGEPLLIPIPMHPARRKARGYNQTETLCESALKFLPEKIFEYRPYILSRVHDTLPQQGLAKHTRLHNVKNSMQAAGPDAGRIAGRVCVVVDDVSTTGATFKEAKRALRKSKARAVHCVALAQS